MHKVRGIWDGTHVRLLDPVTIAPDTEVEVLVPDGTEEERERAFRQYLIDAGIIEPADRLADENPPFTPIPNWGEPISETIIRERR